MIRSVLLLAVVVTVLCQALQAGAQTRVHPAIQGGATFSTLDFDETPAEWDVNWDGGFSLGVLVDVPIVPFLSIVPGVRYLQTGAQVDFDSGANTLPRTSGEWIVAQNYITVLVLAKVRPIPGTGFFVTFGPEVGLLTSAEIQPDLTTEFSSSQILRDTNTIDIKDDMKSENVIFNIGGGFEFPAGTLTGSFEIRFNLGLTDTNIPEESGTNWKTRGVEFVAGIGI